MSNSEEEFFMTLKIVSTLLFSLCLTSIAWAGQDSETRKRKGPPPEAIEACAELNEGDACGFVSQRRGEIQGSCFVPPKQGAVLACKPDRGKMRGEKNNERPQSSPQNDSE